MLRRDAECLCHRPQLHAHGAVQHIHPRGDEAVEHIRRIYPFPSHCMTSLVQIIFTIQQFKIELFIFEVF